MDWEHGLVGLGGVMVIEPGPGGLRWFMALAAITLLRALEQLISVCSIK